MSVKMEKLEKTVVKLEIEVSPEKFEEGLEKSYRRNLKRFKVNGFRQGKVPRKIVEKVYGVESLYEDALMFILPDEYEAAVKELDIVPVEEPKYDVKEIGDGKLTFTAEVTLKPEVKLGDYIGVEIEAVSDVVTDEDVQKELDQAAEKNARMVEVTDRPSQKGDTVNIDFTGYLDGEEFEGGKGESYPLELGAGQFIPGFEDQLIGKEAGAEVDVNVTFPEDYHAENLAGKPVVFKVKIHDIKAKELPVIDDEFASDVSEFDTLAEYKKSISEKLSEQKKNAAKTAMESAAIEAATANAEVEVPECMIVNRVNSQIESYEKNLSKQHISLEQYLGFMGMSLEDMKKDLTERAAKEIKEMLVIEAIAKAESISASNEEIDEEIEKVAKQYNMTLADLKGRLSESNIEYYAENVKMTKAVAMLLDKAKKVAAKAAPKKTAAKKPAAKKTAAKKKTEAAEASETPAVEEKE